MSCHCGNPKITHPMETGYRPVTAAGFATNEGPFRVYRNLNKKLWSVQNKPAMGLQGWRVCQHMDALICGDVTFKVSEAGRQRVIREGRKNVHAYICTPHILTPTEASNNPLDGWIEFTYDPRKHSTFVTLDGQPLTTAEAVVLTGTGRAFAHSIN